MPIFSKKETDLSRQEALTARPLRLVDGTVTELPEGGAKLKVPLRNVKWTGWFFRVPEGATKTFDLDPMGLLVWEACDGKTSVQQIIRRLAKRYNLSHREAAAPTVQFLQTLVKKGLIGMNLPGRKAT